MRDALADDSWRGITEANRADMLAAGIWGVPAFRVVSGGMPGQAQWGQDRLWVIEDDLHALATGKTPPASCA
jgi:2-hydroxychromene-2-carboxylate isomerase